jgi:MFS transporter, DHA3 family, tetracycline resistance protein
MRAHAELEVGGLALRSPGLPRVKAGPDVQPPDSAPSATIPRRKPRRSPLSQVFGSRSFTLIFTGQMISKFGNGVYLVALGWTVYHVTRSAADMGIVLAVGAVPQLLLVVFGGVLGDRLPRRAIILVSDFISALATGALAASAAFYHLSFSDLIVASAVLGAASALYSPAYRAIVSDAVDEEYYAAANGVIQAGTNVAQIIGPGVAGVIYAFGGAAVAFGLDAATFLVAVVVMIFTSLPERRVSYRGTLWADIREGFSFLYRTQWLRIMTGLALIANAFCLAPFFVLLPLVVERTGGGSRALGLTVALEVGATGLTSLWLGRQRRMRRPGVKLSILGVCLGFGVLIVGISNLLAVVITGSVLIGIGFGFDVVETTLIQVRVPRSLLSRVFSVEILSSFAVLPVGYIVAGGLEKAIGITALLAGGGLVLVGASFAAIFTKTIRDVDEEQGPVAAQGNGHLS